jgi:hypothetical protein
MDDGTRAPSMMILVWRYFFNVLSPALSFANAMAAAAQRRSVRNRVTNAD